MSGECSVQLIEKGSCVGTDQRCDTDTGLGCSQPREVGPCRGAFRRWYYDNKSKQCREFSFGGCRGNSNNFIKYEDCVRRCHHERRDQYHDIYLNDEFRSALDVLVKKRREDTAENMNQGFMEIEEQRQVVEKLEQEERESVESGTVFTRWSELEAAKKKLMMMEKHRMMNKQMMMFKQKQMMMAQQKEKMMKQVSAPRLQSSTMTSSVSNVSQDCEVTAWSPWSVSCSSSCGQGYRHRFRSVSTPASGQGRPCPDKLERYKRCRLPACPVDHCETVEWSEWGPCSHTCGDQGVQVSRS